MGVVEGGSMKKMLLFVSLGLQVLLGAAEPGPVVGVGAAAEKGAEVILDGSRAMLDEKWTYWQGPGFASSLPIKWKVVDDRRSGGGRGEIRGGGYCDEEGVPGFPAAH